MLDNERPLRNDAPTDGDLLRSFRQQGDRVALSLLLERYRDLAFRVAFGILGNREDAEDATQDAFLNLVRYEPRLQINGSLAGLTVRMAQRAAQHLARSRERSRRRDHAWQMPEDAEAPGMFETLEQLETRRVVREAVNSLGSSYRMPVVLHYFEGLSTEETARALGISHGAARTRLSRGTSRLRADLERKGIAAAGVSLGILLGSRSAEAAPASLAARLDQLALTTPLPGPGLALIGTPALLKLGAAYLVVAVGLFAVTLSNCVQRATSTGFNLASRQLTPDARSGVSPSVPPTLSLLDAGTLRGFVSLKRRTSIGHATNRAGTQKLDIPGSGSQSPPSESTPKTSESGGARAVRSPAATPGGLVSRVHSQPSQLHLALSHVPVSPGVGSRPKQALQTPHGTFQEGGHPMNRTLHRVALAAAAMLVVSGATMIPAQSQGETAIPPTITSFSPSYGHFPDIVTIKGTNFTGATQVTIGGVPSAMIKVISSTEIRALVRSTAVTGRISVTTEGGTATSAALMTVTRMSKQSTTPTTPTTPPAAPAGPPTITGFTPTSGHFPNILTITGTNLTGATQVTIGGIPCAWVKVVSDTEVKALVRSLAHTGPVMITTPAGTAASAGIMTVTPMSSSTTNGKPGQTSTTAPAVSPGPPTITSFTPAAGKFPDIVTITGTNFLGATQVAINGTPSAWIQVVSPTTIKALVRSMAHTGHITVTTPKGVATSDQVFTVTKTYD